MKKYILLLLFFLGAGFLLAFFVVHPKDKIVPGPVIYKDKIISGSMTGNAIIKPKIDPQGHEVILVSNPSTDFKTAVPVAGEIKTSHVDIKFTGITNVERIGDKLTVDTVFNPDVKETIFTDPVKPKIFDPYIGVKTDFKDIIPVVGFGIEKPLILGLSWSIGGEWEIDNGLRNGTYRAKIHGRF